MVVHLSQLSAQILAGTSPGAPSAPTSSAVSVWLIHLTMAIAERLVRSLPILVLYVLLQAAGCAALIILLFRHFRVTDQLRQLTDVAMSVARGDRQARVELTDGPCGDFARAFGDMVTLLCNEIRSLRGSQRELEQLVATDRLTGVGNRRLFEQQAEAEAARAKRYGVPASLILFDVDHFKHINDRFGHQTGDAVLVNLTRRVAHRLRDTDCIARWGGEEFAILTPCTPISGAEVLGEKIRQIVAEEAFEVVGPVTISLGVAQLRPGETATHWIARADELLYDAKRSGRNCVRSATNFEEQSIPFVLVWGEQFLVHHSEVDAEHAEIFRLANELILGDIGSPKTAVLMRFDQLLECVDKHFRSEEAVLAELGCDSPEIEKHAKLHQGLIAQATDLRRRLTESTVDLLDVSDFIVRRVAVGHLLNADMPLFAALANSGTMSVSNPPRPSLRLRVKRAILG